MLNRIGQMKQGGDLNKFSAKALGIDNYSWQFKKEMRSYSHKNEQLQDKSSNPYMKIHTHLQKELLKEQLAQNDEFKDLKRHNKPPPTFK